METKQTAMQIMLSELKYKQFIYEKAGMYESATALVTSIELAERLIQMEKEQTIQFADEYADAVMGGCINRAEKYYNETYGKL